MTVCVNIQPPIAPDPGMSEKLSLDESSDDIDSELLRDLFDVEDVKLEKECSPLAGAVVFGHVCSEVYLSGSLESCPLAVAAAFILVSLEVFEVAPFGIFLFAGCGKPEFKKNYCIY